MSQNTLDRHVEQFQGWRDNLSRNLKQLRLWLRRNHMFTPEADIRIHQVLEALSEDYLTIAFTGEFSRGKTELINALFFSEMGQRVLPSDAGRTTMCPTELYYDRDNGETYLKLLPIETRKQQTSLADLKENKALWHEIPLTTDTPAELARAFAVITDTIFVSQAEASQLGFSNQNMGEINQQGQVEIPRWRHALISFPHPLLKKGLKILDTPGLNALGSEPELTLTLLPQAQAIIFLLAADAGVTASDMKIWDEYIKPIQNRPNVGIFAVLNKIDVLWDELTDRHHFDESLNSVTKLTARQLNLPEKNVLPLSARKGLVARVHHDVALLNDSRLPDLEQILSHTLLENKRDIYWKRLMKDAVSLVEDGKSNLKLQRKQLENQFLQLEELEQEDHNSIEVLIEKVSGERKELKAQVHTLEPSQRLLDRQSRVLIDALGPRQLERLMIVTRQQLIETNTTRGLFKAMHQFKENVISMFDEFCREAELANKMAEAIYRKYEKTHGIEFMAPRLLEAKRYRRELMSIINQDNKVRRKVGSILTEQSSLIRRFFTTRVSQVAILLSQNRKQVTEWNRRLMYPLEQQVFSRRRLLDEHFHQLQNIKQHQSTTEGRLKALTSLMAEIDDEIQTADNTLNTLKTPPQQFQSNIVDIAKKG
jgi:hypothetical protein